MDTLGGLIKKALEYLYSRMIIPGEKTDLYEIKKLHDCEKGE